MNIYNNEFKPTWLYIKQHAITGKLYFGRTSKKNVLNYLGSGSYWTNHIKRYGVQHVKTLWCHLFFDAETIREFAINFSHQNKIVESNDWANLIIEDGLSSGDHSGMITVKYPNSDKCFKVSKTDERWVNGLVVGVNKNRPTKNITKEKLAITSKNYWCSPEGKDKASAQSSGKNNPMYGKIKEKHWRYNNFNTQDVVSHLLNGKNLYDIAKIYDCSVKCIRCRINSETKIPFKQWRDALISSEEIFFSQFCKIQD